MGAIAVFRPWLRHSHLSEFSLQGALEPELLTLHKQVSAHERHCDEDGK